MRIAQLLGFTTHDLRIAHLNLHGTDPVLPVEDPSPLWQEVLNGQREMACAVTPGGLLVASNESFSRMFSTGEQPANLWRWALFSEEARTVLVNWDERWAPDLIAELRLARYRYPADDTVRALYADAVRDPALQQIVAEPSRALNGRARPLCHPMRGEGAARFMAARAAGVSVLTILFEPAAQ